MDEYSIKEFKDKLSEELWKDIFHNTNHLKYSKTLAKVIKSAKKLYFNNKINHAHNKIKATWNIIKSNKKQNKLRGP
jgi:hypothetical protein